MKSVPMGDFSKVRWNISDHVMLLALDGMDGWLVPSRIEFGDKSTVTVYWQGVAERELHLGNYRIWCGEEWFTFAGQPTLIGKGYSYEVSATMRWS